MTSTEYKLPVIDITKPKYDQNTYWGRAQHFFTVTNPLNIFLSNATLENARRIVTAYKNGTLEEEITEEELWRQKYIYDSAFHPDTGEKMNVIGRMSAQVPMNMSITGGMMTFYKSNIAIIFWQWTNQSFNALVNYSNRSGDAEISPITLGTSYVLATGGAIVTAMSLNNYAKKLPPIAARYVPFIAVAAANAINIPCMRSQELRKGTPVFDENGNRLGMSKNAAVSGISQVVFSRIVMAAPGMTLCPLIMNALERRGVFKHRPWLPLPVQLISLGTFLVFATPLACALFTQKASMDYSALELKLRSRIRKEYGEDVPKIVYYNKGL